MADQIHVEATHASITATPEEQKSPRGQVVADIQRAEQSATGAPGPVKGGPAATIQSIHDRQKNFEEKAADILSRPLEQITKQDAAELQSKEARAQGGVPPGRGSLSSAVQSIADTNDQIRISELEPYITKVDAANVQSAEAHAYGGQVPKGV